MLPQSQENRWVSRTKWLTQALIISGTLNIGLVSTFVYFVLKEKQETLAVEVKPAPSKDPLLTGGNLLEAYSVLPYQELLLRLENSEHVEEGLCRRDFSLACLVAFHHFNLDKALGGLGLQKRLLPFKSKDGQQTIDISVFPGLSDDHFLAIMQYAKTEQWPYTSQGLFYEVKRSLSERDPSLLDAFCLSPEYHAAYTLLTKTGLNLSRDQVLDLIVEGEWKTLADFARDQRASMELIPEHRQLFLLNYLNHYSKSAARLLLENDLEFVTKRLSDGQILTLLDLCSEKTPQLEKLAKELLASPRTDAVCKRAAGLLYTFAGETPPDPCDLFVAGERFLPKPAQEARPIVQTKAAVQPLVAMSSKPQKKFHTVEPGDNLWKIARKYRVSVEEIMRVNQMTSERLRVGKQLEIPEKRG